MKRLMGFRQLLALLILTAIMLLLLVLRPEDEPVLQALAPSPVLVSEAARTDLFPRETVSGRLQPARRAWLRFEVDGLVAARHVEAGKKVRAGDVLLELEGADYRDALVQARAEWQQEKESLERDKRLLELARRSRKLQEEEVTRLNSLKERSLASKTLLGDAQALLAQRQAEEARLSTSVQIGPQRVEARRAALDRAERDLARTRLKAPFEGRVNQVELEVGDYAGRNQPALEVISDRLDFYVEVRGPVARALSLGDRIPVRVGDTEHRAVVAAVQPDPDPATFTHAVRLRMPETETRSGILATAELPLQPLIGVLVVPATAVLREEGSAFVFRVSGESLHRVPVTLGARVGNRQVISAGLEGGERVVMRDVSALSDGQAVVTEALTPAGQSH
jgi:HlyD family secretion protein